MLARMGLALLSASWLFGLGYFHMPDDGSHLGLIVLGVLLMSTARWRAPRLSEVWLAALLLLPVAWFMPWPYRWGPLLVEAAALAALVAALRGETPDLPPFGWGAVVAAVMFLGQGVALSSGTYRTVIATLGAAVAINVLPIRLARLARVNAGMLLAGGVLLVQTAAIYFYEALTAVSHELPAPLPGFVEWFAARFGIDAAATQSTLTVRSMRVHNELGATWELVCDPASFCFLGGALFLLGWGVWSQQSPGSRARRLALGTMSLLAGFALWLPLRAALYLAIYLEAILRLDFDAPLTPVRLLWNHWLHLALLVPASLFAWRIVARWTADRGNEPGEAGGAPAAALPPASSAHRRGALDEPIWTPAARRAALLLVASVTALTLAIVWDPPGGRRAGRVLVEEFHPPNDQMWERTDKPFDTSWYGHLAGYNYYCIYDYCDKFFQMSRLEERIGTESLAATDVLMIKVPTHAFLPEEIEEVVRFVENGGGLMLVGEHTNVFGSGSFLNPIARRFGFTFRYDTLFGIDRVFDEPFEPSCVPHPIVQHIPAMEFATSCSIAPSGRSGRTVIRGRGLKSLDADYHISNFLPPPDDRPEMRYGAFVQLYATRFGKGRVIGFTDSTIFSNFCTFEPGKPELMLGMLEWLNRGGGSDLRPLLLTLAGCLGVAAVVLLQAWRASPLVLVALAALAWCGAGLAARAWHSWAMPLPEKRPDRTLVRVGVDQHLCDPRLPKAGFVDGKPDGFGIFERWILRLGYFTTRYPQRHFREHPRPADDPSFRAFDEDLFSNTDLVVFCYPKRPVTSAVRQKLVDYVNRGGKVLVLDSAQNTESTANDLLEPFELLLDWPRRLKGDLAFGPEPQSFPVEDVLAVTGGTPLATLKVPPSAENLESRELSVAATRRIGKGSVTVVGFGSRFSDAQMGVTGDVEPGDELSTVYQAEYRLVRGIIEDTLLGTERAESH